MQAEANDRPAAIETQEPITPKRGQAQGGIITVYRLNLMTPAQIEAHGLTQYVAGMNKTAKENDKDGKARRR
ncbi:hypothetical protein M3557_07490 [Bhargavaea ginsengi]|uniref:hypothetical protein n=1 Tax=Bhargavaea ginsengi TaxID=426757 RepID=UPI00203E8E5C|nr:hypothetical protein [Bhargavaea ginsengi]MCM3087756.1 hypothetical protein [Bhargavaea ginsengi]